ncbi:hypothetical protein [Actinomadura formosensis]|uniref:hypothetical protein n=1 Tax=Actinomadura formosensis TaxID=60706 RepID=UPI0008364B55|nr:hypothetical protein [Actinomadura formosensis]
MTAPDPEDHHRATGSTPRPLTDSELDARLGIAHEDLVAHASRHADPLATLLALLTVEHPAAVGTHPLAPAQIITGRIHVYEIIRALQGDFSSTEAGTGGHARSLELARAHTLELVRLLSQALPFAHAVAHTLDLAVDLAQALDRGLPLNADPASDLAAALVNARSLDPHYALAITRERSTILALISALSRDLPAAPNADHDHQSALDHAFELTDALARLLAQALDLAPIDASGADLSALDVPDAIVLADVVWDDHTTWPTPWHTYACDHSIPLEDHRYQIRTGTLPHLTAPATP